MTQEPLQSDQHANPKADIRTRMRGLLASMTDQQRHAASVSACARLLSLESFQHAGTVMLYLPLTHEVDLTPAAVRCFQLGKTVCVPKVDWDRCDMAPVEITCLDDRVLDTDEHGVRCPRDCRLVLPATIDLVVVPALAYDPRGNRLGRGGGYYDRFLKRLRPACVTVGLAFDQQIIDQVPANHRDVAVDIVVTDRRVSYAKAERSRA